MIEIQGLSKTYRMGDTWVQALRGVSLTLEDGDFVAIMGPSGSGKSTLANILGLLDVPTSGSYNLNGKTVSGLSEDELALLRRHEIGFIFQQFNLLPRMSALENVLLPHLYSKKDAPLNPEEALKLLGLVGLEKRAGHRPTELSGGQQQRVAIARALINHPRIILADEPTGNLDSESKADIMSVLKSLNASGITIVIVTHEDEIAAQAKRVIRVRDGVIQTDSRNPGSQHPSQRPQTKLKVSKPTSLLAKEGTFSLISTLTSVAQYLQQGFKSLRANKIRTALSMLGVLIGVAAFVTMLALGRGAQKAIETQLASLGSNLLILQSGSTRKGGVALASGTTTRLTFDDMVALQQAIPSIRSASATVNGRGQITHLNKNWNTYVQGTSPSYAQMRSVSPKVGRFFNEEENKRRSRVAVIGVTVADEVFGSQNPIGEMIKINKVAFQVIGVLPEKGATGFRDQDDIILVPVLTAMRRLLGKEYVDSIDLEVNEASSMESTQEAILNLMYSRKRVPLSQRQDAFRVFNMADIQEALAQSSQTISTLLASIAAISLLVGGIGIMNIMLVSVTERTKEIGLRKAIGARRKDILLQFLTESIVVSSIGGLSGIAAGWAMTLVLSYFTGWATSVSPESVFLSFFFSAFIGVVFGIYPARKASLLHPIDALRYE